jgi:hypothetical protein
VYVIKEVAVGRKYFKDPSFDRWDLVNNIEEATKFETYEKAKKIEEAINLASLFTYWDFDEIPPKAEAILYKVEE